MDEFAQSREDDDLFADEFEPVSEATVVETRGNRSGPSTSGPTGTSTANNKPPAGPRNARGGAGGGAVGGREGGRGGRGGNRGGGGLGSSRYATQPTEESKPDNTKLDTSTSTTTSAPANAEPLPATTETQPSSIAPATATVDSASTAVDSSDVAQIPTSEQAPIQPQITTRTTAVRGDRHLTGGPAHKKLTEAELSEKMEKMKILNAQKAERFRLSEEDSAAYARKEKEMAKKRVEEQKNARAMDMERAKNRQRKLAAQGGREWDSEKQESDIVDGRGRGRSSEFVRGGHGGVIRGGLAGSRYAQVDGEEADAGSGPIQGGRGRGGFEIRGRGNRGGRGGSRGGKPSPATIPTPDDFPELPTTTKSSTKETTKMAETVKSPIGKPAGDWAEEMATPVEEKKSQI